MTDTHKFVGVCHFYFSKNSIAIIPSLEYNRRIERITRGGIDGSIYDSS